MMRLPPERSIDPCIAPDCINGLLVLKTPALPHLEPRVLTKGEKSFLSYLPGSLAMLMTGTH